LQLAVSDEMRAGFQYRYCPEHCSLALSVAVTGLLADWLGTANMVMVAGLMLVSLMLAMTLLPVYRQSVKSLQVIKEESPK
jgi:hypothetical protein